MTGEKVLGFPDLHLRVHDARVLTLPVDMVDLGEVVLLPQGGIEDVVHVDWQNVQETRGTCGIILPATFPLTGINCYLLCRRCSRCGLCLSRRWSCQPGTGLPAGPEPGVWRE